MDESQMTCPKCGAPTYCKDGVQHCMLCWWENPCLDKMTVILDNPPDKQPLTTK